MELRRQEPNSPGKAITARALAAAEHKAVKAPPKAAEKTPSQQAKKDAKPKKTLSELVKNLENSEILQRVKKRALAEDNRKLKGEIAKADKLLKGQVSMTKQLETQNASLRKIRDELAKELDGAKDELMDEREKVEGLNRDLKEHKDKLKDGLEQVERLSKDLEEQKSLNGDLAAVAKQSAFESRLHRTALAAGFKILPSLADQVTFRNLVVKTEHFLRQKIANQEAVGGVIPSIEHGTTTGPRVPAAAANCGDSLASAKAKQFKFACEDDDDDDDDEDVKPPCSLDFDEDCKMLCAGDVDDSDQDSPPAIKSESPTGVAKTCPDAAQGAAAENPKRKLEDAHVSYWDSDSDIPLAKQRKLEGAQVIYWDSDSDVPLAKKRKVCRRGDTSIGDSGDDEHALMARFRKIID